MIIDKNNLYVIDTSDFCLHDLLISSFNYFPKLKILIIKISDYKSEKFTITFENVFEFKFSSVNRYIEDNYSELNDWEVIPNEYTKDNFIEETKEKTIENGGEWNHNLFAVRFLMSNMNEIKIISERINII